MRKLQMHELNRLSPSQLQSLPRLPVVCVLDNIRSQHNIGSVFRTSDAFRINKLVLCGITATPPNREIHKAALGATESVEWQYESKTIDAINALKSEGYCIVAIEQAEGSIDLADFEIDANAKVAFVFGNEVNGVDDEVMNEVDYCVEIPQFGTKHSFNVSVTAGIVLYNAFQSLKKHILQIDA